MRINTEVISKKNASTLLGMKISHKFKKKVVRVDSHTIKYRVVFISNINGYSISAPVTYNCISSIFIKTEGILEKIEQYGEVYLAKGRKLFRLLYEDHVFDKCMYYDPKSKPREDSSGVFDQKIPYATFKMASSSAIFVFHCTRSTFFTTCSNIKKLVIKHSFVQSVCLEDLKDLNHLDLSHNYLENINLSRKIHYCNLSFNNLSSTPNISANNLNLSHNFIVFFYSENIFQVLNLQNNPLKVLAASGKVVNVSNTKIRNLFCKGVKKLICCNNWNVSLLCTEDIVYLNMNNCNIQNLRIVQGSLKVVKLRNNKMDRLPRLGYLEHLDLSGNNIKYLSKYTAASLNISRNPLKYVLDSNSYTNVDLTYTANFNNLQTAVKTKHPKKKSHDFKMVYKLSINIPRFIFGKFFFVVALNRRINFESLVATSLSRVESKISNTDFFYEFVNAFESVLTENLCRPVFYAVMVEESKICIQAVNFSVVFSSFAVHKIIERRKIYLFENIGEWRIFPILGCTEFIRQKSDAVGGAIDILSFMDMSCLYTKQLEIFNNTDLYKECTRGFNVDYEVCLGPKCNIEPCNDSTSQHLLNETGSYIPTYNINTCSIPYLKYLNTDFSDSLPVPCLNEISEDFLRVHDTNTFIFLKFNTDRHKDCINIAPLNHIIGTLCKIFQVILFEQHDYQCGVFLGFNRFQGLIFAMYVHKILSYKGIRLSIGVVCGDYSLRWSLMFPKVFGYGLNKSARFASMGEGVFCCKCVKLEHKNLVFVSHGERYMKGFSERMEVFSVHFSDSYI
ncbi:putative serine/threonine-protein kinase roco5 [Nosema granulosis]|uniref:Serine/threonine-protein kinase roco5 n=1 Tax=Nosema granulosis TaxID=83296 RepID=A0A9P6GZ56_9MICR|nr:putative serine/threonine-protein kinase roco5 [Nosema granulosis]